MCNFHGSDPSRVARTTSAPRPAASNRRHWALSALLDCLRLAAIVALLMLAYALLKPYGARADIITEFGGGLKSHSSTSYVLRDGCHTIEGKPCGGDNPLFIGWPVAYQTPGGRFRVGWFHMSHWFDGGKDRETHFDCLCASWTFNWARLKK